jgi:2-polyprenyl-6-methoxyphenol hydroxylase-like FAD-dependent oxidoreductase
MARDTIEAQSGRNLAVVIGGSMAGLWAAQVLLRHFARVAIVDRDSFPDGPVARKGVPQGRHVHVLLGRGMQVAEALFPGITAELAAAGAPEINWGSDALTYFGPTQAPRFHADVITRTSSRPLLEALLRQRLRANPRVVFLPDRDAIGLLHDTRTKKVLGVRLRQRDGRELGPVEELRADLTVDASGRDTKTPAWLQGLGYGETEEVTINAFLGYATRWYRPPAGFTPDWKVLLIFGRFPHHPTGGVIFPIEDGRWIVTLSGMADRLPPTDEVGFREFARTLSHPSVYEAIKDAEPISPLYGYRRTENILRRYERLPRWPRNYAAIGDAVCAFNPVYGQGMTASGVAAQVLDRCLREGRTMAEFQRRLAQANAIPWTLSTSADFRWPTTVGGTPDRLTRLMHRYMDYVQDLAAENVGVLKTFQEVLHMTAPPAALFRPPVLGRVLARATWPGNAKSAPPPRRKVATI